MEVSLLGVDDNKHSDWFCGEKMDARYGPFSHIWGLILRFTAGIVIVDTENMAAVEMNRNQSNTSIFGKFMADLPLEKAQDVLHEGTFTKFSSRQYGVRI